MNFYRSLVTIDPTKPRWEAIQLLENDLKGAAFVHAMHSIISDTPRIQNCKKNSIGHIANVDKQEAGLEKEDVERSQSKKRMNAQPETKDNKRRQTGKATGEATDVESDGTIWYQIPV